MPDPRFFQRAGPQSLAQLAEIAGATLSGSSSPSKQIADVAMLQDATSADLVYLSDKKLIDALQVTKAGACLIPQALAQAVPATCAILVCADPRAAFAKTINTFYPTTDPSWSTQHLIEPSAEIHPSAIVAAGAVVAANAKIGARTKLGPHAVIGPGVVIGDDCIIGANVTILCAIIGQRVILHAGVQIGQDGFGYTAGPTGPVKVPQLGRVIIHDEVEIGANCTIDRGMLGDTVIGRGCKLDNLVQIAHNVVLGQACILVSQAGIAGSCIIGDGVVIGPQVGVIDHITIGAGAQIAGQTGVHEDIKAGAKVMGYPARPIRQFWREIAALTRLTKPG